MITPIKPRMHISFYYTNHENKRELRNVAVVQYEVGTNEWYPQQTLFIRCWDFKRKAERSFDVQKIEDLQTYWRREVSS